MEMNNANDFNMLENDIKERMHIMETPQLMEVVADSVSAEGLTSSHEENRHIIPKPVVQDHRLSSAQNSEENSNDHA